MKRLPSYRFSEGPWHFCARGRELLIHSPEGEVLCAPARNATVDTELGFPAGQSIADKREANVRLMAAAPDLLELLEALSGKLRESMEGEEQKRYGVMIIFSQKYLDELDSILEKARGPKS